MNYGLDLTEKINGHLVSTVGDITVPGLVPRFPELFPNGRLPVAFDLIDGRFVPMIYETMVFDPEGKPVDMHRYLTEDEARRGHADMLSKWANLGVLDAETQPAEEDNQ